MKIRLWAVAVSAIVLTGCVRFDLDKSLSQTNSEFTEFTTGNLQLRRTQEQREQARSRADSILDEPLDQAAAVELALLNSPAVQTMLANHWDQSSSTALSGSIPNPVFEFGRLSADDELEIERILAIGLLDLLRLPMLSRGAKMQLEANQVALAADTVDLVTRVRQAWINAVASRQLAIYAKQIFSSAEASAVLATNMQAIGNFNAVSRARQQNYYADAATNLTIARHRALASREALVRLLGLDDSQTVKLQLPSRLPNLPDQPIAPPEVTTIALEKRLDVNMAMTGLKLATMQQGLKLVGEITDIEIAAISESVWKDGEGESARGYEIGIELPIFKNIGQVRNRLNARSLAASSTLESVTRSAISHLRESYSAYRSNYDIAKHYRDEVVPLQQLISEENVLNYNGMIIGVFELLADSRTQIQTVQSSIESTSQFWLADAALRASLVGKPASSEVAMAGAGGGGEAEAGH